MIQHVSIVADRPEQTAGVLARIIGGIAIPLGPARGSWTAVGTDPLGNVVEVMPRGTELHPGKAEAETRMGAPSRHSGVHLLVESPLAEDEVMHVACEAGVRAYRSVRQLFGELIEVWLDECLLVEVLPFEWARNYRRLIASVALRDEVLARIQPPSP